MQSQISLLFHQLATAQRLWQGACPAVGMNDTVLMHYLSVDSGYGLPKRH